MDVMLAHPGGHGVASSGPQTWEAMVVIATIGLVMMCGLLLVGWLTLNSASDLVVPAAATLVVTGIAAGSLRTTVGDWFPWAAPVGAVLLVGLVVAATTRLELSSWVLGGPIAVAAVAAALIIGPVLRSEPAQPAFTLAASDDASLAFVGMEDGAELVAGRHVVTVGVTGGSIGPAVVPVDAQPDDPEELGHVRLYVGAELVPTVNDRGCTVDNPCRSVTFEVSLDPGAHLLVAEFLSANGLPLSPSVTASLQVVVR